MRVAVGNHLLDCTIAGSGAPAVVIEPGFGGDAADWAPMAARIGEYTTVVTYDRAAYGHSSRATDQRTGGEVARDLAGVLDAAGVVRPVVLVGHSLGGIFVRAYTAAFDGQVAGMVLVDSSTEGQHRLLDPLHTARMRVHQAFTPARLILSSTTSRHGADRRSILREWRTLHRDIPPYLQAGALRDRPLVVLTQAPQPPQSWWQMWYDMHRQLARLSSQTVHVVADVPGHYIQKVQPDLVTMAVRAVVDAVRDRAPLRLPASQKGHTK